jgi:hypothetical protein
MLNTGAGSSHAPHTHPLTCTHTVAHTHLGFFPPPCLPFGPAVRPRSRGSTAAAEECAAQRSAACTHTGTSMPPPYAQNPSPPPSACSVHDAWTGFPGGGPDLIGDAMADMAFRCVRRPLTQRSLYLPRPTPEDFLLHKPFTLPSSRPPHALRTPSFSPRSRSERCHLPPYDASPSLARPCTHPPPHATNPSTPTHTDTDAHTASCVCCGSFVDLGPLNWPVQPKKVEVPVAAPVAASTRGRPAARKSTTVALGLSASVPLSVGSPRGAGAGSTLSLLSDAGPGASPVPISDAPGVSGGGSGRFARSSSPAGAATPPPSTPGVETGPGLGVGAGAGAGAGSGETAGPPQLVAAASPLPSAPAPAVRGTPGSLRRAPSMKGARRMWGVARTVGSACVGPQSRGPRRNRGCAGRTLLCHTGGGRGGGGGWQPEEGL